MTSMLAARAAGGTLRRRARMLIVTLAAGCCAHFATPIWGQTNVFPGSGNVGIGTATPAAILHSKSGGEGLRLETTGTISSGGANFLTFYDSSGSRQGYFGFGGLPNGFTFNLDGSGKAFNFQGGNVGIGTTMPSTLLTLGNGSVSPILTLNAPPSGKNNGAGVLINSGSVTSSYVGHYSSWFGGPYNSDLLIHAINTTNNALHFATAGSDKMVILQTGNVGIGTTNPTSKLSVNGTIQAKEVVVNTGWADYVFTPAYRLRPLREVAMFIRENHHLPEIPSEAEVQEKGIGVGDMQAKLLAKIEELTLHMIRAEERNDRLEREVRELRSKVSGGGVR